MQKNPVRLKILAGRIAFQGKDPENSLFIFFYIKAMCNVNIVKGSHDLIQVCLRADPQKADPGIVPRIVPGSLVIGYLPGGNDKRIARRQLKNMFVNM